MTLRLTPRFRRFKIQWTRRKPFPVWCKRAIAMELLWGLATMLISPGWFIAPLFAGLILFFPAFCGLLVIDRALAAESRVHRLYLLRLWWMMAAAGFVTLALSYCPYQPKPGEGPIFFLLPLAVGAAGCIITRRFWRYAAILGTLGLLQTGFIRLILLAGAWLDE